MKSRGKDPVTGRAGARKLVAVICAAAIAMVAATTAHAYVSTEIGQYQRAEVTCDAFNNTIAVRGIFGAGTYYNSQYLRVRYWAVDVENNQSFWLSPNGAWTTFLHKRWDGRSTTPLATNVPYETYPINFPDSLQGYWRFQVYVQYGWYTTTGWAQTQGIKTNSYYSGWGSTPDCYL